MEPETQPRCFLFHLSQHTLCVLNRERFVRHYPEQAAIAREFVRTFPGIREYRFDRRIVAGLKGVGGS